MTHLIQADTLTDAWVAATDHLHLRGRKAFGLVTEIIDPAPERANLEAITLLNALLHRKQYDAVGTVSNTIFPAQLARTSQDRQHLYARYMNMYPRIRHALHKNGKGTYFGRLIAFPLQSDPERANQIETIITDLQRELTLPGPLGSVYEAQVFVPGKDRRPMGFPCMSSLSFQLDAGRLHLTATYRNQYYIQKALGNFLGLAHLHQFVADEVGLQQGSLTIHAFHAVIDPGIAARDVAALLNAVKQQALISRTGKEVA